MFSWLMRVREVKGWRVEFLFFVSVVDFPQGALRLR